ncbi:MAG: DUF2799 domain-containing protein [Pseudomonadota bacterium]
MLRIFAFLAAALVLGSCTTLSEDACRSGDWFSIGVADGERGRTAGHLAEHGEACGGFDITPDRAAWEAGRQQGLRTYCTVEVAYSEGRRSRTLSPVCPAAEVDRLQLANETGRSYRRIELEIERLERKIFRLNQEALSLTADDGAKRGDLLLEELRLRNRILQLRVELRDYDRVPVGL